MNILPISGSSQFMAKDRNKTPTFPAEVARVSKLLRKEIYAGDREFKFLPLVSEEWTAFHMNKFILQSEVGEILVDAVYDQHGKGKLWAVAIMEVND